jgi:hypothetical protein
VDWRVPDLLLLEYTLKTGQNSSVKQGLRRLSPVDRWWQRGYNSILYKAHLVLGSAPDRAAAVLGHLRPYRWQRPLLLASCPSGLAASVGTLPPVICCLVAQPPCCTRSPPLVPCSDDRWLCSAHAMDFWCETAFVRAWFWSILFQLASCRHACSTWCNDDGE